MRFFIIFLLFINAVLFGQLVGWLPTLFEDSVDTSKVQSQVSPDMARVISLEAPPPPVPAGTPLSGPNVPANLLSPPAAPTAPPILTPTTPAQSTGVAQTNTVAAVPTVAPVTAPPASGNIALPAVPSQAPAIAPAATLACLEVGPVSGTTAQMLQTSLLANPLIVASRFLKQDGRPDDQTSYMVILEGASNQKEAQAREQQARGLGAKDAFILQDGPNKFAVSLGIFRAMDAANSVVEALGSKGLLGMRVITRPGAARVILKVPNIAPEKVEGVRAVLAGQAVKACTAAN